MDARWIVAGLALGAAAAGGAFLERDKIMPNDEIHGTLRAGLGDTIAEVAARSTYPLDTAILQDEDLSAADRPVQFSYVGPGAIALPPTRTVSIDSMATVVTGIQTAPQLEFLGRDGVLALADKVEPAIVAAGWQRDAKAPGVIGRGELAVRLSDPAGPEATSWHIAAYRLGDAQLLLRLRRMHRAGPDFPDGGYLLNFVWDDDKLRQQLEKIVDRLRREDGVTAPTPRRVDASAYGARVRALLPR